MTIRGAIAKYYTYTLTDHLWAAQKMGLLDGRELEMVKSMDDHINDLYELQPAIFVRASKAKRVDELLNILRWDNQ